MTRKLKAIGRSICIIGAGGHCRVVYDLAVTLGYSVEAIYEEKVLERDEMIYGAPVQESFDNFLDIAVSNAASIFIAIGDISQRRKYKCILEKEGLKTTTLVHPLAFFSRYASIKEGCFVGPFAIINASASIGEFCNINSAVTLEHEVTVGEFCNIHPRATINGRTSIGNNVIIGSGATVIDYLTVCDNVILGAGAVVLRDILEPGTYVGVPARLIRSNR